MSDQSPAPSGLYAYTECETVTLRPGVTLVMDWWSDAQMVAAPSVAEPMQYCRRFRTLEEHAEVLMSRIPELAGQQENVMSVLNMVRDNGLMVSAESVCDKLNVAAPDAVDQSPSRGFIITCDRPAAVERLLETMLRGGGLSRQESLFLVDDSRDPGNAARNREAVEQFNLTSPRDMHYFGAEEAARFMAQLIAALPQHEEGIRFLIDRQRWAADKTYGLARNLCLLLSVGYRAVVLDDDVLFQVRKAPQQRDGIDFGSDARNTDFFASEQEMLSRCPAEEFDPFSGHNSCLGLSIAQTLKKLFGDNATPADLAGANSSFLNLWQADSPVLITQCGSLGDPGSPGNEWLYLSERENAQRLATHPGGIEQVLSQRTFWLGNDRPSFAKMAVMSQATGLDNSQLLPPYFPLYRGEDYLFGAMTEFMHPHAAVLNYNWAIPHLPVDQRSYDTAPPDRERKGQLSLGKYITDRTIYRRGMSAATRLQLLATMARELSQSDERALKTLFRKEVAEMQGLEMERLTRLLSDGFTRPQQWQEWLGESLTRVNQAMQSPAQWSDLPNVDNSMSDEQLLATFKSHMDGYSQALAGWEDIRGAAGQAAQAALAGAD